VTQLCKENILYVDDDATGNNNGSCWADAFECLQDALAAATAGTEIRVAQGSYRPDCGEGISPGEREATFQLKNGVTIKGGYAGLGRPHPGARHIDEYPTILSGDLAGNDEPDFVNYGENSYHVVTGSGTDGTAVLDGFTITHGGVAKSEKCSALNKGGGMRNDSGSPTVLNCTFIANVSTDDCGGGGAMYNRENSNPTVRNCTFVANVYINADDDGGGAVRNIHSHPAFEDCIFTENFSNGNGGAMLNVDGNPTLTRCTFMYNYADHEGGAIDNHRSSPVLNDCVFMENLSRREGGAIRNTDSSKPVFSGCVFRGNSVNGSHAHGGAVCNNYWDAPKFVGCLFTSNSANLGGAMYSYHGSVQLTNCTFSRNSAQSGGATYYRATDANMTNCIVWGDRADLGSEIFLRFFEGKPATLRITYSDIAGGREGIPIESGDTLIWGPGNMVADPCFVAPADGDYHLKSLGWRWDATGEEWTFDRETSRCIDAGNPGSPLGAEPLSVPADPNNDYGHNLRINMGAYGGTAEASMPPYGWALAADLNNDGIVNFCDLACGGPDWLKTAPQLPCDINRTGAVGPPDLALLADDWLRKTTWED